MDAIYASRAEFLRKTVFGGGALALLSACGSGSPAVIPLTSRRHLTLDEALFALNAYAVYEGGNYYIRSDKRSDPSLQLQPPSGARQPADCGAVPAIAGITRPADTCDGGDGGAILDPPTIVSMTVYGQGTATLSGGIYDFYLSFGGTFSPFGGGSFTGPIYRVKPPALSCVQTALGTVGDQIRSVAEGIVGGIVVTCAKIGCGPDLLNAARGVISGTVSLAEFADVLIALVSAVDLPTLLAACGVSVGIDMIYQYIKCLANGG